MSKHPRPELAQVVLAFAGIYIIWSTTFLGNALVIRTIPPFFSGTLRFLLSGGLMYGLLRARDPRPFSGLNIGGSMLCGVLMTGMGNGFIIWSQQGLPSGICALFVGVLPVSTLLLDWLFFSRRAPSYQSALGVAVGLAGVVVLTLHTHSFSGAIRPVHVMAVLAGELAWSAGTLLQPRYVGAHRVLNFSCLQMLTGAVFQLLMGLLDREWIGFAPSHISLQSALGVLYLVIFGSMVAVNCYAFLVAHVPAQKVTTYALVNPVMAMALGAVVLHEKISPIAILSAILVLAGVALILFQRRPIAAQAVPAVLEVGPRSLHKAP
jgi:drug/metabolite transporter (DMT)-like permease